MKTIKIIKATDVCKCGMEYSIEYTIGKKRYEVQGEFYYNKKKERLEHLHEGPRGGQYLIIASI